MTGNLDLRRKGLEESFFAKENERLKQQIRLENEKKERREHLEEFFGKENETLIEHLVAANIEPETIPALALVPLVYVAWADDELEDKERRAILSATTTMGIKPDSPSFKALGTWLEKKPDDSLLEAWSDYYQELVKNLDGDERKVLENQILENVEKVARSAGGILGLQSISQSEKQMIAKIQSTIQA